MFENTINADGLRVKKHYVYKKFRNADKPIYDFFKRSKNGDCVKKDIARTELITFTHSYFNKHGYKKVRGLTLPGIWFMFEKELLRASWNGSRETRITYTFHCCEIDYKLFKIAAAKMPSSNKGIRANRHNNELNRSVITNGNNVCLFYADIFEFVKVTDKKFDFIWLDITSTTASTAPKLHLFERVLNDRCVFAITLLKARDHVKLPQERVTYLCSMMEKMNFGLDMKAEYQDTVGSPMLQLVFSRKCPIELPNDERSVATEDKSKNKKLSTK